MQCQLRSIACREHRRCSQGHLFHPFSLPARMLDPGRENDHNRAENMGTADRREYRWKQLHSMDHTESRITCENRALSVTSASSLDDIEVMQTSSSSPRHRGCMHGRHGSATWRTTHQARNECPRCNARIPGDAQEREQQEPTGVATRHGGSGGGVEDRAPWRRATSADETSEPSRTAV